MEKWRINNKEIFKEEEGGGGDGGGGGECALTQIRQDEKVG